MISLAAIDLQQLPRDVDVLLGVIGDLQSQYATILDSLRQQLLNLRRLHFGATSEKLSGQPDLFPEKRELPVPPEDLITVSYQRQRRGRPALPKDLPRVRVDYDLSAAEKAEFDTLERIGEEVSETLEYTPAKLLVIEHARAKYACSKDGEATIRTAFAQPSPLPKTNAGAGLLAQILVSTFADHLPLNRQERIFKRHGVDLPRSTLCEWKLASGELLAVLRASLIAHTLKAPRLHTDDTTMPLIEGGRGCTRTARLWGYLGAGARRNEGGEWAEHPPSVVFEFTTSRESKHPIRFLKDYQGYLQADAYSGYDALYRDGRIIEVGCFAHYPESRFIRSNRRQGAWPLPFGRSAHRIRTSALNGHRVIQLAALLVYVSESCADRSVWVCDDQAQRERRSSPSGCRTDLAAEPLHSRRYRTPISAVDSAVRRLLRNAEHRRGRRTHPRGRCTVRTVVAFEAPERQPHICHQ